ncbi:hypothetical protein V6N13_016140 [Hibiscus sabdariffa]
MYGFSLWPFTLNSWLSIGDLIVVAPWGKTFVIVNGPDHLDLSFPGNNLSRELKRSTCCPVLISCNSLRSKSLFCPAASQSMFTVLIAHASWSRSDQSFRFGLTTFSRIVLISLLGTSACPLVCGCYAVENLIIGRLGEGLANIIQIAALLLLFYSRRSVLHRVLNGIVLEFGVVHLRECIF